AVVRGADGGGRGGGGGGAGAARGGRRAHAARRGHRHRAGDGVGLRRVDRLRPGPPGWRAAGRHRGPGRRRGGRGRAGRAPGSGPRQDHGPGRDRPGRRRLPGGAGRDRRAGSGRPGQAGQDAPALSSGDGSDPGADAFELAPAMMGVVELTDDDILHLRDNHANCAFFGVPVGQTANRLATALGAPRATVDEWLRHYRASGESGQPVRFEYRHGAGPSSWLQVVVAPMAGSFPGRRRFMYVADDVTARMRANERLETMFRTNLIGNMTWRIGGGITSANDAFLRIVGHTQEDIAAGRVSWRELTPPEYAESDRRYVEQLEQTGVHGPYEK